MRLEQTESYKKAIQLIRSYGSIAIIGAGISAATYPMAQQLSLILWDVFDSNPHERKALAQAFSEEDSLAKLLIGDADDRVKAAWLALSSSNELQMSFKRKFIDLDLEKQPTDAHFALAKLIKDGYLSYVISLNWDSALERAYEQLFGSPVPCGVIEKPHGDVFDLHTKWVFPYEGGSISDEIITKALGIMELHPRVFLEIGYSGQDRTIQELFVEPIKERSAYYRIGPSISGASALCGTADEVLSSIATSLGATGELKYWLWVSFAHQRSISAAVSGYRLGPQDARTVPELPGVSSVVKSLHRGNLSLIVGESGTGKSITAFQAACRLQAEGWSVVELLNPGTATLETVREFSDVPGRIIAIVDDAQALPANVFHAFRRSVSDDHVLIACITEWEEGPEKTQLDSKESVACIKEFCLNNEASLLGIVSDFDNRVGYDLMDESFARRVNLAGGASSPWEFMSILRGDDRGIRGTLRNVSEPANILFAAIATEQLLSLDEGIIEEDLCLLMQTVFNDAQYSAALLELYTRRLIFMRNGYIRTPHLRFAHNGIFYCLDKMKSLEEGAQGAAFVSYTQKRLKDETITIKGKLWLTGSLEIWPRADLALSAQIYSEDVINSLVSACVLSSSPSQIGIACQLLRDIYRLTPVSEDFRKAILKHVEEWLRDCTDENAYGIGEFISGLRSDFEDDHDDLLRKVPLDATFSRMLNYGTVQRAGAWERLITEYTQISNKALYRDEFTRHSVNPADLANWFGKADQETNVYGYMELIDKIGWIDPSLSAAALISISSLLASKVESDPVGIGHALWGWFLGTYDYVFESEENLPDCPEYKDAILQWIADLNWQAAGGSVTKASLEELNNFDVFTYSIGKAVPEALELMMGSVDAESLEELLFGNCKDHKLLLRLLYAFCYTEDREPGYSIIKRHEDEWIELDSYGVPFAPDVAVRLAFKGNVILQHPGLAWQEWAYALQAVFDLDQEAARKVLRDNKDQVAEGLLLRQSNMVEGLGEFLDTADMIDSNFIESILSDLSFSERAESYWPSRAEGEEGEVVAVSLLEARTNR